MLYVVLSPALLTCHRSEKIEKSCSNSFSGLIFQVLQTQRSSVSITLSVVKQKKQKVALRRWVFLGHTQPVIHPAWTRVQKCPADPDQRHFVNSPHCCSTAQPFGRFVTLELKTREHPQRPTAGSAFAVLMSSPARGGSLIAAEKRSEQRRRSASR